MGAYRALSRYHSVENLVTKASQEPLGGSLCSVTRCITNTLRVLLLLNKELTLQNRLSQRNIATINDFLRDRLADFIH